MQNQQRIQIVLPDPVAAQLHELAASADEPPSTLAGQMVRDGVAVAAKDGKHRPLRRTPVRNKDKHTRDGLSPTAAIKAGGRACGGRS